MAVPAAPVSVREAMLTVLTADEFDNPIYTGGAAVGAKMSGPGACCTSVEDHGDGSYTIAWAAALSGTYRLGVLVNGAHVRGSVRVCARRARGAGLPVLHARALRRGRRRARGS